MTISSPVVSFRAFRRDKFPCEPGSDSLVQVWIVTKLELDREILPLEEMGISSLRDTFSDLTLLETFVSHNQGQNRLQDHPSASIS